MNKQDNPIPPTIQDVKGANMDNLTTSIIPEPYCELCGKGHPQTTDGCLNAKYVHVEDGSPPTPPGELTTFCSGCAELTELRQQISDVFTVAYFDGAATGKEHMAALKDGVKALMAENALYKLALEMIGKEGGLSTSYFLERAKEQLDAAKGLTIIIDDEEGNL